MKYTSILTTALATFALAVTFAPKASATEPWVTAYLPAWEVSQNSVVPANIDLTSVTDLVWFSLQPQADGTLAEWSNDPGVNSNAAAVATACHSGNTSVIISIGGAGSESYFNAAFNAGKTQTLVNNIVAWMNANGYDGVDIDDEPLQPADSANYQDFITKLKAALPYSKSLFAAVEPFGAARSTFASIYDKFDQINIMSYDMIYGHALTSGLGEVTWFNSPLYSGSNYEQDGVTPMSSIAGALANYENAPVSIPAYKLSIGTAFYGYDFGAGCTSYEQAYTGVWSPPAVSYNQIMTDPAYYKAAYYHFNNATKSSYIGRLDTGHFITYDDPCAVAAKVDYVMCNHLGGLVCFEVGQQYMGGTNPLLHAIDCELGN